MKNKDIENLVKGGERVIESALAVLACALGAGIVILIAILLSAIK